MVIDGRAIAGEIVSSLKRKRKPKGELVAVFAGDSAASQKFLREKGRVAGELGIPFRVARISARASEASLLRTIQELNRDRKVRGIVLQLPLPRRAHEERAIVAIDSKKDVDALRGENGILPPAAGVVKTILGALGYKLRGKRAVVVGRGTLVGGPVAAWLAPKVGRLDQFHRSNFNWKRLKEADLIVSGAGTPGLISGSRVKRGAILIDFGYGVKRGKVSGDFDFKTCAPKAGAITPTPGGTGPILVAELFRNFFLLAKKER